MRCIISGFDAFGGDSVNPSEMALRHLPETLDLGKGMSAPVNRVVLPTCGTPAWYRLRQVVAQVGGDERFALVLTGLHGGNSRLALERCALNVRHYTIADNCGNQVSETPILSSAPAALTTQVDIATILRSLRRQRLKAQISFHAGTFICNETYFRALRRWGNDPRCLGVLFMHLPSPASYAALKGKGMTEAKAIESFAHAVTIAAKHISTPKS